ncbi:MAG TPA: GNAT family N-acetyltransferase [Lysobacter sp.]
MTLAIKRAVTADLDQLAPLFDAYRMFYDQPQDPGLARAFLAERIGNDESVVLLATVDGAAAGFTQLYPGFSSVRAARVWLLNDLFVAPGARRHGVGQALLAAATAFARETGAARLELETMPDNVTAQALYESTGWQRYDGTFRYRFELA